MVAATITNKLIAALPADLQSKFLNIAEGVDLSPRQSLEEPGKPIPHVYLIDAGLVSVVATGGPHRAEVGLIGCEGVTGLPVILGAGISPHQTIVQGGGSARRIAAHDLATLMNEHPLLGDMLRRFAHVFMVQTAQTALSNSSGKITVRLARWLLMVHDRLKGDQFNLTHEFIALMLSVRRQGVTVALHELEGRNLIQSRRSAVKILDRDGLIKLANGSYGVPEAEYRRVMAL